MKFKMNRIIVAFCTIIFTTTTCNIHITASSNFEPIEYCLEDGIWSDLEPEDVDSNDLERLRTNPPPSSYDITTNPTTSLYFPAIGNQGNIQSCSGWATTYYQYTYEVNRLKGIATTTNNTYSPAWTYNYINLGSNMPTMLDDAYFVLKNQGAMLLSDYPHPTSLSSYSFTWPSDLNKMRAALRYRVKNSTNQVSYSNLSGIDVIKDKISEGKPAVIWTNPSGWNMQPISSTQSVIVRESYSSAGGHFMTVVGYDDNFSVIVNGQTLTGAFKLANSGGSTWNGNGYIWVMYDALLLQSAYGTAWQVGLPEMRSPVFGNTTYNEELHTYSYYNNQFTFVNAYKCDNYFTETLEFTSYDPWRLNVYGKNGTSSTASIYKKKSAIGNPTPLTSPDTRYLVFDYTNAGASLTIPNSPYSFSTAWTTTLYSTSSYSTYNIKAKLTDNLGNLIEPYNGSTGTITNYSYSKTHYSNVKRGRVTAYDTNPITNADAQLILQYIALMVDFSTLQYCLADYNSDGTVDVSDVVMMYNEIEGRSGRVFSLYDNIPGENYSIRDFIEQTLGESYEEYVMEHISELNSLGVLY